MNPASKVVSVFLAFCFLLALVLPAGAETPRISSIDPSSSVSDEPTDLSLTGEDFEPGARVALLDGGIHQVARISALSGPPRDCALSGDQLYVASNHMYGLPAYLDVFDVADPTEPALLHHIQWPQDLGGMYYVASSEDYVLLLGRAWHQYWLIVVDKLLWDPASSGGSEEDYIHAVALPHQGVGLAVSGDHVYIIDTESDLQVAYVGDVGAPRLIGGAHLPGYPFAISASGDYVYVLNQSSNLLVLDVSNPAAPERAGSYNEEGWYSKNLAIGGSKAYLLQETNEYGHFKLTVLDLGDPTAPTLIGSSEWQGDPGPLSACGEHVCVTGRLDPFSSRSFDLWVIDINDPNEHTKIATYCNEPNRSIRQMDANQDYAFLADYTYGAIDVVGIGETAQPDAVTASHDAGELRDIEITSNHVFMANGDFEALDISDPDSPVAGGGYHDDQMVFGEFELHDGHAYVLTRIRDEQPSGATTSEGAATAGPPAQALNASSALGPQSVADVNAVSFAICVFDVSDPASATLLNCHSIGSFRAEAISISGDRAYVGGRERFAIFNVSDPTAPYELGSFSHSGHRIRDVEVWNGYAHLATYGSWVDVFDITDPTSPQEVGAYGATGISDVEISNGYSFVTTAYGLETFDISDPTSPVPAGAYYENEDPDAITIDGHHAYLNLGERGFKILDISDPHMPVLLASYKTPSLELELTGSGNHAITSDGSSLRIVRLNGLPHSVATPSDTEMGFTLPEGYPTGPYHLRVTNPGGEHDTLYNGFRICEPMTFSAVLAPADGSAAIRESTWRIRCDGDEELFEPEPRHTAMLLLPDLPEELEARFQGSDGSGEMAIEVGISPDTNDATTLLYGDDAGYMETLWDSARRSGGFDLPHLDARNYGDILLDITRRWHHVSDLLTELTIDPPTDLTAASYPIRYRYTFNGEGELSSARAWGEGVGLMFEVKAEGASGCESTVILEFTGTPQDGMWPFERDDGPGFRRSQPSELPSPINSVVPGSTVDGRAAGSRRAASNR